MRCKCHRAQHLARFARQMLEIRLHNARTARTQDVHSLYTASVRRAQIPLTYKRTYRRHFHKPEPVRQIQYEKHTEAGLR